MTAVGQDWRVDAVCRTHPQPNLWFADHLADRRIAYGLCEGCPVIRACAADANSRDEQFGIWGGRSREPARRRETRHTKKRTYKTRTTS